jgi:hypothetical protein
VPIPGSTSLSTEFGANPGPVPISTAPAGTQMPYGNDVRVGQIPTSSGGTDASMVGSGRDANGNIIDLNFRSIQGNTPSTGNATPEQLRRILGRNRGGSLLNGAAIVGDKPSGKATGYEEMVIGDALILDRHKTKKLLEGRGGSLLNRMAGGGIISTTGGANYDPGTVTYNTYADSDLFNQSFLRKIRGDTPGRSFGAFGGGNTVGPYKLPVNLSIQRYNALLPTEQAMTKGAYDDPRAGIAFDDVVEMAKRASVGTTGFGGSSAYG